MLENSSLMNVQYTRCLATPVLAAIETNGMQLDTAKVEDMYSKKESEYGEIQNRLEEITGGINTNSGKQLGEYIYETLGFAEVKDRFGNPIRTAKGARSVSAGTLSRLQATTKAQREFIDLYKRSSELNNELSKYLRKFKDCCTEAGGILQGVFNQCNTRTHRLSSNGLDYSTQFQNFPRAYKPIFKSKEDGWFIGEADGAQLEFRVAAHLGRDGVALGDIVEGVDIHSVTAGIIGSSRQEAKAHTFKPLYGGKSGTPNEVKYYDFFREKYKGIADTQRGWISSVLRDKHLTTEWGLRYYWPDTTLQRSGYVTNSTSICNYPVQAFATAEIIPVALVYFWHYIRAGGLQMQIVNTVHDSVITEFPPEEVDDFHQLSKIALIDEVYRYLKEVYEIELVVPLGAGVSVGSHWGDEESKNSEVTYTADEESYVRI